MNNLIATIETKSLHIYEDEMFYDDEEKEKFKNSSEEQKYEFLKNYYYDHQMYLDREINIDLYE